jgi:TrmH family RNA methyltransferase
MGAVFSVEFIKTTAQEMANWKRAKNVPMFGTSDAAKTGYQEVAYPKNMILMMGSERQGLQQELMRCCDEMVAIPMTGKSDSLNLAVATAVTLYEIYNQQRKNEAA